MGQSLPQAEVSRPKTRRFRFGIRALLILILIAGFAFGRIARMRRQALEQERFVAELARDRILVNHAEPTILCFVLMKVLATDSRSVERRCSRWLGPGWFSRPRGFNAGRIGERQAAAIAERLRRLGAVWEVTYTRPSLDGLRLFYIDRVPYNALGPDESTCIIKQLPATMPAAPGG